MVFFNVLKAPVDFCGLSFAISSYLYPFEVDSDF
jgi:hypothetical protein